MDNNNEDKIIYRMMEYSFLKANGREVSADSKINADLYPADWASNDDYLTKSEILGEAIQKKIPITETERYQQFQEGVRMDNSRTL